MNNYEIINHIEENYHSLFKFIADNSRSEIDEINNVKFVKTVNSCWPNAIFKTDVKNDQGIDLIKQEILNKRIANKWLIGPNCKPENLPSILQNHRFRLHDTWKGMACNLDVVIDNNIEVDGLKSIHVSDYDDLKRWAHVATYGLFRGNHIDADVFKDIFLHPDISFYLGLYDDKPVATSMGYFHKNIAGIYIVSVLPDYRRKGIGTAITSRPVIDAVEKNCSIAVLEATKMGESVYKKIGFKEYCLYYFYAL